MSTKAPISQRIAAALVAVFCIAYAGWFFTGITPARWFVVGAAAVVLGGAFIFGHVALRGRLPGRFLAGGNAFVGADHGDCSAGAYSSTPVWERVVGAALAIGGAAAIGVELAMGGVSGLHHGAASVVLALGGIYLFGYVALRGHLPGPYPGGGNAAMPFHSRRRGG